MTQTKHQTELDNRWHDTGYEELGISFDPSRAPNTLRRFLVGETSDQRAQAQNEEARQEWEEKEQAARAAARLEKFALWVGIPVIVLAIVEILCL
jgi:hypothetical protein